MAAINPENKNKPSTEFDGEKIKVYDLLGMLTEEARQYGIQLFVLAGEMRNGYLFEKASVDYLNGLDAYVVADSEGNIAQKYYYWFDVYANFHLTAPEWAEEGKTYTLRNPLINEEDSRMLRNLAKALQLRLEIEHGNAAEEFYTVGTAMGGEARDQETLSADIQARLNGIFPNSNR